MRAQSCLTVTPWTVACQASLSMEFSMQEYWSGLPFPSPPDNPLPPSTYPKGPFLAPSSFPTFFSKNEWFPPLDSMSFFPFLLEHLAHFDYDLMFNAHSSPVNLSIP